MLSTYTRIIEMTQQKIPLIELKIKALEDCAQLIRIHVEFGNDFGFEEDDLIRFDRVCKQLADKLDKQADKLK